MVNGCGEIMVSTARRWEGHHKPTNAIHPNPHMDELAMMTPMPNGCNGHEDQCQN